MLMYQKPLHQEHFYKFNTTLIKIPGSFFLDKEQKQF